MGGGVNRHEAHAVYEVADRRWRREIEWSVVVPTGEGMFPVRTRVTHVRAGEIEVRRFGDVLACWIDGYWRPVGALRPTTREA